MNYIYLRSFSIRLGISLGALLAVAACSSSDTVAPPDSGGGIDIRDGTDGLAPDVITPNEVVETDGTGADASDVMTDDADLDADLDADSKPGDGIGPDAGPGVGDGSIGSTCFLDEQCSNDALCLDWAGGYCTHLNCPAVATCPAASACVTLTSGTTACLAECAEQSDCRPGYGCKPFKDGAGEESRGCVVLADTPNPAGGPCADHTACEGALSCLPFVAEGYCAQTGCSADTPCADGQTCVTYNGQPTCLPNCGTTDDCLVSGATERICGPLLDIVAEVAQVCIPATEGVGVGNGCTSDIECDSGQCRILAEGKCVASNLGCFTDADCPGAGVCELAPAYVKGTCTQACGSDLACPGNSQCVDTQDGLAWCNVPCTGINDKNNCDQNVGESCVFGDPIGDTTGNGKYACTALKPGDPGTDCTSSDDCKDGALCFAEPTGTCAPTCNADLSCPFPTVCVTTNGEPRCLKRCNSVLDCPGELGCIKSPQSPQNSCVP